MHLKFCHINNLLPKSIKKKLLEGKWHFLKNNIWMRLFEFSVIIIFFKCVRGNMNLYEVGHVSGRVS